ncbi:MAG: DUF899 family protein [Proteobacteria bacterium]|nr:DUF899 family protein [Pseudomonadota bacterium]
MKYRDASAKLIDFRRQIAALRDQMRTVQEAREPEPVEDYEFATPTGTVRLSALFAGKPDLIVIHNMGRSCPHCTLWADGYNGLYPHLADRAGFVVTSPDAPAVQRAFAQARGWRFAMASHAGTRFATDMGYGSESGGWLPGLSVFRRDGGRLLRVADAGEAPGDDFCALWHLFDLLPGGVGDWQAKFHY